jgi:hypothetical protein
MSRTKGSQQWEQKYIIAITHFKIFWIISKSPFRRNGKKLTAALHLTYHLLWEAKPFADYRTSPHPTTYAIKALDVGEAWISSFARSCISPPPPPEKFLSNVKYLRQIKADWMS